MMGTERHASAQASPLSAGKSKHAGMQTEPGWSGRPGEEGGVHVSFVATRHRRTTHGQQTGRK